MCPESHKEEKVRLSVCYHMLFFEKQDAFVQHLSGPHLSALSLNANIIADASRTQSNMCMSFAFPSASLLGAISRQKSHWRLRNVCKS